MGLMRLVTLGKFICEGKKDFDSHHTLQSTYALNASQVIFFSFSFSKTIDNSNDNNEHLDICRNFD